MTNAVAIFAGSTFAVQNDSEARRADENNLTNIREYNEEYNVEITKITPEEACGVSCCLDWHKYHIEKDRWVIYALNEGECNSVRIDLVDVLRWVKDNMPELLKEIL